MTKILFPMRINKTFFVAFASLLCLAIQTPMKAAITEAADTVIIIEPMPGYVPPIGPKAPAIIPISANYDSMLSQIFLNVTSNLGEIEVEVLNTTTGGYDAGTIDTQLLYATVPITMGPGHYLIIFTLPSGRQYKGEFDC